MKILRTYLNAKENKNNCSRESQCLDKQSKSHCTTGFLSVDLFAARKEACFCSVQLNRIQQLSFKPFHPTRSFSLVMKSTCSRLFQHSIQISTSYTRMKYWTTGKSGLAIVFHCISTVLILPSVLGTTAQQGWMRLHEIPKLAKACPN